MACSAAGMGLGAAGVAVAVAKRGLTKRRYRPKPAGGLIIAAAQKYPMGRTFATAEAGPAVAKP